MPTLAARDLEIGEACCAERFRQPLGVPDHDEGQLVRTDDRPVGLGGSLRRHRTQQRQASVDVVVGKAGENLGGGLISDPSAVA